MMEAWVVNIPDPNTLDDRGTMRDVMANILELVSLKSAESAVTIAGAPFPDNGVNEMTIEGWLNGQG